MVRKLNFVGRTMPSSASFNTEMTSTHSQKMGSGRMPPIIARTGGGQRPLQDAGAERFMLLKKTVPDARKEQIETERRLGISFWAGVVGQKTSK